MTVRPLFTPPQAVRAETAPRAAEQPAPEHAALSTAERQALAQQFPESPSLALRLYGPTRTVATPVPALGTHLDLRG